MKVGRYERRHALEWYQSMFQTLGPDGLDACCYACIVMVMVVMQKVIVCSFCDHDVVGMCCSGFKTLQNFGLHSNFGAYCGSYDHSFLLKLLVSS